MLSLLLLLSSSPSSYLVPSSPWVVVHGQILEDVVGVLPPPSSSSSSLTTTNATISGIAFYDQNANGIRDPENAFEMGIIDVSVWLFSCDSNSDAFPLLQMTETDEEGDYVFENIEVMDGRTYYVNVQPPRWYALTPVSTWEEVGSTTTATGEEESVVATKSSVDPSTGNTPCFELTSMNATDDGGSGGIGRIVNVGLVLNVDPGDLALDVPTNAPAGGSTAIGTVAPSPPPPPSSTDDPCPSPFCNGEVPIDVIADGSSSPPRSVNPRSTQFPPPSLETSTALMHRRP